MKTFSMIILLLIISSFVYAGDFKVETGYGYFLDSNGDYVCNAMLPAGNHPIKDGYSYVEVSTKEDLDNIAEPVIEPTQEQIYKSKISDKMQQMAIAELKKDGELPPDYKLKERSE